jgi:drug/metabolite transporter (DMT)-like permease
MYRYALVILVGMAWSVQPALVKMSISDGFTSSQMLTVMVCGVGIFAFLGLLVTRRLKVPRRSVLITLIISALFAEIMPAWIRTLVAPHMTMIGMAIIVSTTPLLSATLSFVLKTEKISLLTVVAILTGLSAVGITMWPENLGSELIAVWSVVCLGIPLSYAISQQLVSHRWPDDWTAYEFSAHEAITASLILLGLTLVASGGRLDLPSPAAVPKSAILWIFITLGEGILFFVVLRHLGPLTASLSTFVAIVFAPIWDWSLFSTALSSANLVSGVLILATIALMIIDKSRADHLNVTNPKSGASEDAIS